MPYRTLSLCSTGNDKAVSTIFPFTRMFSPAHVSIPGSVSHRPVSSRLERMQIFYKIRVECFDNVITHLDLPKDVIKDVI